MSDRRDTPLVRSRAAHDQPSGDRGDRNRAAQGADEAEFSTYDWRCDDGHLAWLAPHFGETCYRLGYEGARRDGVIAPFDVVLVRLECSVEERAIYDEQTETMSAAGAELIARHGIPTEPYAAFLSAVSALARTDGPGASVARVYLSASQERRRVTVVDRK